jgi:hypothetical protein
MRNHQRGSIIIKLVIIGAVAGAAAIYKAPDGESYLQKGLWYAQHGYDYAIGLANQAKAQAQAHEDATQKAVDSY